MEKCKRGKEKKIKVDTWRTPLGLLYFSFISPLFFLYFAFIHSFISSDLFYFRSRSCNGFTSLCFSMTPCLLKLKVTPGFYFPIVIPDNVTASIKYITLSFLKCCATTYKEDKIRWGSFQESTFYCQVLLLQRPTQYLLILFGLGDWDTVRISIWL